MLSLAPSTSAVARVPHGSVVLSRAVGAPRAAAAPRTVVARAGELPEAILFDCDGVLVDTEKDGHRVAFNAVFKEKGLPHEWDVELYGELLEVGGGKERMTAYFSQHPDTEPWASVPQENWKDFMLEMHLAKTALFMDMVKTGEMPLRPGVKRLFEEAIEAGLTVAICSTSNEKAVTAIRDVMLGPEIAQHCNVYAGDMVKAKKPAPDVYLLAAEELGLNPANCVVIEDSGIGLKAAKAAGMKCVVTKSSYTENEDFSAADAVVDCIGDAGDERFSLQDLTVEGLVQLSTHVIANA